MKLILSHYLHLVNFSLWGVLCYLPAMHTAMTNGDDMTVYSPQETRDTGDSEANNTPPIKPIQIHYTGNTSNPDTLIKSYLREIKIEAGVHNNFLKEKSIQNLLDIVIEVYARDQSGYFLPRVVVVVIRRFTTDYAEKSLLINRQLPCMQAGLRDGTMRKNFLGIFKKFLPQKIETLALQSYGGWYMNILGCNTMISIIQQHTPILELRVVPKPKNDTLLAKMEAEQKAKKFWVQLFQDPRYKNKAYEKAIGIFLYENSADQGKSLSVIAQQHIVSDYHYYGPRSELHYSYAHTHRLYTSNAYRLINILLVKKKGNNKKYIQWLNRIKKKYPHYRNMAFLWNSIKVNTMQFFPNYDVIGNMGKLFGKASSAIAKVPFYTERGGYLVAEWIFVFKSEKNEYTYAYALMTKVDHSKKRYFEKIAFSHIIKNIDMLNSYLLTRSLSFLYVNGATYQNGCFHTPIKIEQNG